jgi:S-disulfanyl-L-cysteine oxidoreductase SoxD
MKKLLVTAIAVVGCGSFVMTGVMTGQQPSPLAVYTAAQAEAGKQVYQMKCARCHTNKLTGRKGESGELPALSSLEGDDLKMVNTYGGKVPPLAGPDFMKKWGGQTTKDFSNRVKEAPGGPGEAYLSLTAYILQVNGARPGTQELAPDTAVELRSIMTRN